MRTAKQTSPNMLERDVRWEALVARDPAADGSFVYAVKTTGVYCRPSCASRLPKPENVSFHADSSQAERAGFRPCKRCTPDGATRAAQEAAQLARACRSIEGSAGIPLLSALAAEAGMSPFHFHRRFKAAIGVTPRAYAAAHRSERVRAELASKASVTEALYGAGYSSASRFYEQADAVLGMKPKSLRKGAPDVEVRFATGGCSLGTVLAAQTDRGVCAILLGDDPQQLAQELRRRFPSATLAEEGSYKELLRRVIALIDHPQTGADLPLDIRGTAFQQRVWQALRRIPAGHTLSYTELAEAIGAPRAVRAVASACAANTLAVAVPCHRVVGKGGSLAGYRWGVERKQALLAREAQ